MSYKDIMQTCTFIISDTVIGTVIGLGGYLPVN